MRKLFFIICTSIWICSPVSAEDGFPLEYEFVISFELSELNDLTLGDDPAQNRLDTEEYEFEFDLFYQIDDRWYAFFAGSLKDETETIESAGLEEDVSGFERKKIGVGLSFGDEIESELNIGRIEFTSISEWWLWWDEELDAIRLESSFGNIETLIGFAEEQARESTDLDFIDPEIDGIKRIIASLAWEFMPDQSLHFYFLDQDDNSDSFYSGFGSFDDCNDGPPSPACVSEDFDKIDEEDADLTWTGVSYLGEFETDRIGELEVELHYARVKGDETLYEFDDPDLVTNLSEVTNRQENRIDGFAQSFFVSWTPAQADDWSFILGRARGSREYRQTGLQGDSDVWGELYQPELANLIVETIGVEWEAHENVEVALRAYEYQQVKALDEIRDVSIDADPSGLSTDLGNEIDLVVTIQALDGMELNLIIAEFDAGKAYDLNQGESSQFWKIEIEYEF